MNEANFAPKLENPEDNSNEKKELKPFMKIVEADKDGHCSCCGGEFKKGERIALYLSEEDIETGSIKPAPYLEDCVDRIIVEKSAEKE